MPRYEKKALASEETTEPVAWRVKFAAKIWSQKTPKVTGLQEKEQSTTTYRRLQYINIIFTYLKLQSS